MERPSAHLSHCGRYRYSLERFVGAGNRVALFVGVNPSTADATTDDQTVRKWRGFSERLSVRNFIVCNIFAFRATDVREVAKARDPVGPANELALRTALSMADLVVPCWGSRAKLPKSLHHHIQATTDILVSSHRLLWCWGTSKSGDPLHPLTLGYDRQLVPFHPPPRPPAVTAETLTLKGTP